MAVSIPLASSAKSAPPRPQVAPERLQSLDALRGFALFGIIVVNAPFFAGPPEGLAPDTLVNVVTLAVTTIVFAGKFFLIFSFLFGFGFATILARANLSGTSVRGPFLRRLLGLFIFGAVHAVALFFGDILMLYALLGLILWCCRGFSPETLLRMALVIFAVAVLVQAAILGIVLAETGPALADPSLGKGYLGGFSKGVSARLDALPDSLSFVVIFNGLPAFAMFLSGLALGKSGRFPLTQGDLDRLAPQGRWALMAGLIICAASAGIAAMAVPGWPQYIGLLGFCAIAPVLSFGMAIGVLRLAERFSGSAVIRWLAVAGASSLSGYILHSVLLGAVFYGWGLGAYGSLGDGAVFGVAIATFAAVVWMINLWRGWFRYGLEEWLLRSFVDLKWKPLRR